MPPKPKSVEVTAKELAKLSYLRVPISTKLKNLHNHSEFSRLDGLEPPKPKGWVITEIIQIDPAMPGSEVTYTARGYSPLSHGNQRDKSGNIRSVSIFTLAFKIGKHGHWMKDKTNPAGPSLVDAIEDYATKKLMENAYDESEDE